MRLSLIYRNKGFRIHMNEITSLGKEICPECKKKLCFSLSNKDLVVFCESEPIHVTRTEVVETCGYKSRKNWNELIGFILGTEEKLEKSESNLLEMNADIDKDSFEIIISTKNPLICPECDSDLQIVISDKGIEIFCQLCVTRVFLKWQKILQFFLGIDTEEIKRKSFCEIFDCFRSYNLEEGSDCRCNPSSTDCYFHAEWLESEKEK